MAEPDVDAMLARRNDSAASIEDGVFVCRVDLPPSSTD
jgi:hypothetical protein